MRVYQKRGEGKELLVSQDGSIVNIKVVNGYDNHDFELSMDEARALRDNLIRTINKYDENPAEESGLSNTESYEPAPMSGFFNDEPSQQPTTGWNDPEPKSSWSEPEPKKEEFKLFKKKEDENPKTKFYY